MNFYDDWYDDFKKIKVKFLYKICIKILYLKKMES